MICLAWVGIAGSYALIVGGAKLWDESWQIGLVSAAALAWVIYFYYAKDEANQKRELTPKLAEEIIRQYADAMVRSGEEEGTTRRESYLPCSKEKIKQACKLTLAFLIEHNSLNQQYTNELLSTIMYLDSFVPDDKAERINSNRSLKNKEYADYCTSMISSEIRFEMDEFIEQVEALDSIDPLFHQKVYTLIGLEYSPAVKKKHWDDYWEPALSPASQ